MGKDLAVLCSKTSSVSSGPSTDIEIKMGDGYILGIGVCPSDRIVLETMSLTNTTGIMHVEDDGVVSIATP